MPNFVYAGFNGTGDPSELKRFIELMFRPVVGADNARPSIELMFDFSRIIPLPAGLPEASFRDWAIEHWGVKWNALDLDHRFDDDNVGFQFTTAWDFPTPVFETRAAEFPAFFFTGSAFEESHEFELLGEFNGGDNWGPGKIDWILGGPDDDGGDDD